MNKTKMTKFCTITFIVLFLFSAANIGLSRNCEVASTTTSDIVHRSVAWMDDAEVINVTGGRVFTDRWAGQVAERAQNDFTDVSAQWHVPHIESDATPNKSMVDLWVGIGHLGPIIQVGTELSRDDNGVYHYKAWYENWPDKPVYPGGGADDVIACHNVVGMVWQVNDTYWHVSLTDATTNVVIISADVNTTNHQPNQKYVECIAEPHLKFGWELPNFGTVTFKNCYASIDNMTEQPMKSWNPERYDVVDPRPGPTQGDERTSTGFLSNDGLSFDVTFIPPKPDASKITAEIGHGPGGMGRYLLVGKPGAVAGGATVKVSDGHGHSIKFPANPDGSFAVDTNELQGSVGDQWQFEDSTDGGTTWSDPTGVTLTVFVGPVSISPTSATIDVGQSVAFTSTVTGGIPPYTGQWYLNGNPVPGADETSWMFIPSAGGIYYVWKGITDNSGTVVVSETARIEVIPISVGGYSVPVNAALSVPYIGLASTIVVAIVATAIYTKRIKRGKEKQYTPL